MRQILDDKSFVNWFYQASPYINSHRGKTFVILFDGETLETPHFSSLIHDFALLQSLGIKLILVHGARPQIEERITEAGLKIQYHKGIRITNYPTLSCVKQAIGKVRFRIEAALSMGQSNSPMHGASLQIISGNFITAQPLGIVDGIDYHFTGKVRKIATQTINNILNNNAIILLSPLGYSLTGEIFNLYAEDVAVEVAQRIKADKLLFINEKENICNQSGQLIKQLTPQQIPRLLKNKNLAENIQRHLSHAYNACSKGVTRIHLINHQTNGSLLLELFTRKGVGTMISNDSYENIRPANIDDIANILSLIQPMEKAGILVKRSRDSLEMDINNFFVMELDKAIIGCAMLKHYPNEQLAELGSVVIAKEYQGNGKAKQLLNYIEKIAKTKGTKQLFVLTTQTAHWFQEQGFNPSNINKLPIDKQNTYNTKRGSKIFSKKI